MHSQPILHASSLLFYYVQAGAEPNVAVVDLTKANGVAFGIRYGWLNGGSCCSTTINHGCVLLLPYHNIYS